MDMQKGFPSLSHPLACLWHALSHRTASFPCQMYRYSSWLQSIVSYLEKLPLLKNYTQFFMHLFVILLLAVCIQIRSRLDPLYSMQQARKLSFDVL